MEFLYTEPKIRWVTFGMQGIEQTEEFAVAYIANIHQSWLPYGMPGLRVCGSRLFAVHDGCQRSAGVCHRGFESAERDNVTSHHVTRVTKQTSSTPGHPRHFCTKDFPFN
jgi:hypothetical protein